MAGCYDTMLVHLSSVCCVIFYKHHNLRHMMCTIVCNSVCIVLLLSGICSCGWLATEMVHVATRVMSCINNGYSSCVGVHVKFRK